ncbi:MAG: hypothetical protein E7484_03825 [Ruminococcaceae bacterium]|nr:hypothetical protein [Oscillospiraceae bacterium]
MLHKIRAFLKNFIFAEIGIGVANCVLEYFKYQKYGHLTAVPLHMRLMISMGLTLLIVAATFAVWAIMGYVIKRKNND